MAAVSHCDSPEGETSGITQLVIEHASRRGHGRSTAAGDLAVPLVVPLWAWPTLLSLDAPAVAVAWQLLLARQFGVAPSLAQLLIVGLSVWLAYAADRLLDGLRQRQGQPTTVRHAFYAARRWPLARWWLLILAADLALAATQLQPAELLRGGLLLLATAGYLVAVQWRRQRGGSWLPRELQVGLLFGGGTTLFLWGQVAAPEIVWAAAVFAVPCLLNCLLINSWERTLDLAQGLSSLATRQPGLVTKLPRIIIGATAAALAAAFPLSWALALAIAGAGLLLLLLHAGGEQFDLSARRLLADIALLLPALLVLGLLGLGLLPG